MRLGKGNLRNDNAWIFQSESTGWDIFFSFRGREGCWEGEVLMALRKCRMASLGGRLWNEVLRSLKVAGLVGFSQERNVLFTGRNKNTKGFIIKK